MVLTDTIPTDTTYVANSATQPVAGSVSFANNTLTWTIPSVPAGAQGSVLFKVKVD